MLFCSYLPVTVLPFTQNNSLTTFCLVLVAILYTCLYFEHLKDEL